MNKISIINKRRERRERRTEQHEQEWRGQKAEYAQVCRWSGVRIVSCMGGDMGGGSGEWDIGGGKSWAERREAL